MKLFLDQNLSQRILPLITHRFPGSTQARLAGLASASDHDIWEFAKRNALVIVTRDADFPSMCLLRGAPPRVIWLRSGNPSWRKVADALLQLDEEVLQGLENGVTDWIEITF